MPWRRMKRSHLEPLVLGLVLDAGQALGRRAIVGQLEDAAEQHRHVLERDAGALLDLGDHEMAEIGVRAAEVEVKLDRGHASPFLREGTDLELEGPRVARLLVELPVGVGDRGSGRISVSGRELRQRRLALAPRGSARAPRRCRRRHRSRGARRGCSSGRARARRSARPQRSPPSRWRRRRSRTPPRRLAVAPVKKMRAAAVRQHETRRLAAGEEARVARHLPDLAEHALGRLEEREVDVGADVEDADLERRRARRRRAGTP